MAQLHAKALEQHKVIPDVLDQFTPSVRVKITYGSTPIVSGSALRVVGTQEIPEFRWESGNDKAALYTLVMVDPDAPSPDDRKWGEYLHWIVTDIPGSFSTTCQKFLKESHEVVSYKGPAPPEGLHRYIFVVYKQEGKFQPDAITERKNFKLREWAKESKLGSPLYAAFFYAEKNEGPRG